MAEEKTNKQTNSSSQFHIPLMRRKRCLHITSRRNDSRVLWETLTRHTPASSLRGGGWICRKEDLIRENQQRSAHQPTLPTLPWAKAGNALLHHKPIKKIPRQSQQGCVICSLDFEDCTSWYGGHTSIGSGNQAFTSGKMNVLCWQQNKRILGILLRRFA